MPFTVIQASEILSSKYRAHIDSASQGEIHAEIPFDLDGEHVRIKMLVNAATVTPYGMSALGAGGATVEQIVFERRSNKLLRHPQILALVAQIRADLGALQSVTSNRKQATHQPPSPRFEGRF